LGRTFFPLISCIQGAINALRDLINRLRSVR
ncbi:MAG: hypothetical protein ACI957_003710, partial [Verrucomicrobiales bacterium]